MDKYEKMRTLGRGSYGTTELVRHIVNDNWYAMKLIECKDEPHAKEAKEECLKIAKLSHPYMCAIHDVFVYYDIGRISFFLIIITPYYNLSNCRQLLERYWNEQTILEQSKLENWVVQILELLSFLHSNQISHLNIKPENLFIDFVNKNAILIDFGLITIMNDKRRLIRIINDDFWSSPIVAESIDNTKVDVWSFGIIIYAFMTTGILSKHDFYQLLQSTDKYKLNKLKSIVKEHYSHDFIDMIIAMIDPIIETRLNIKGVTNSEYYIKSFSIYSSKIVHRKNRQRITPFIRPIPYSQGPGGVIHYINWEKHNEYCVQDALAWFHNLTRYNIAELLPHDFTKIIIDALNINNENELICIYAVKSLTYLAMYSDNPEHDLFQSITQSAVMETVKVHPNDSNLRRYVASYFIVISSYPKSSKLVNQYGVIEFLINSLKNDTSPNVIGPCMNALWNLCVEQTNCELAIRYNARDIVMNICKVHYESIEVIVNAIACLLAFITSLDVSLHPENLYLTYFLLNILKQNMGFVNLVKYTLILLENLVEMNEEHGMQLLECTSSNPDDETINGIDIFDRVFHNHDDNSAVVTGICRVIMKIVSYPDLIDVMLDLNQLFALLIPIQKRFKHSRAILNSMAYIYEKIDHLIENNVQST